VKPEEERVISMASTTTSEVVDTSVATTTTTNNGEQVHMPPRKRRSSMLFVLSGTCNDVERNWARLPPVVLTEGGRAFPRVFCFGINRMFLPETLINEIFRFPDPDRAADDIRGAVKYPEVTLLASNARDTGTLRELGINQLKDRLKLFNSIVTLKERYAQITQANQEQEINNSMINEPSRQWEQHSRLYDDKYIIEEEKEGSVINDSMSVSSVTSNNTRRNEYINSALAENRNNTRQINGPVGMRPRLNSIVSRESLQLTNTNFSYYRSAQRANRAPSQSSKSSISSISSFFRRLSFSKPSKKNDSVFEPMFQQADYQGWLWTRFDKNAKWKKRWIILSREKVYFLKEPKHPVNIKHTIQLNITFSIQPDIHKGKTKYTFNLIDSANQQITYFSADNHLVMMTWINVLVRATTNAASRLQPCPEGKSPIIPPQSPATGITPIYGISSQSPYHQPHQVQQSPQHNQSPQVIRNSGYIPSGRPSMISQNVSPRIQQAIITHNLPTQVRKSSMGMMNSSIQNSPQQVRIQTHSHHHQSQLTHSPIEGNITPPNTSVIIENKEE